MIFSALSSCRSWKVHGLLNWPNRHVESKEGEINIAEPKCNYRMENGFFNLCLDDLLFVHIEGFLFIQYVKRPAERRTSMKEHDWMSNQDRFVKIWLLKQELLEMVLSHGKAILEEGECSEIIGCYRFRCVKAGVNYLSKITLQTDVRMFSLASLSCPPDPLFSLHFNSTTEGICILRDILLWRHYRQPRKIFLVLDSTVA